MNAHTAYPDLLGRHDTEHGRWEVVGGRMQPGMAWTAIATRQMSVPNGDTEVERVIRAHEMMHAKISPTGEQMVKWLERARASIEALTAAEELRDNTLVKAAGFNVDVLTDGSETQAGEFLAQNNRWAEAVQATCAFANTGRFKAFLVGVRRHNPEWAKTLRAFHDRLVKELSKVHPSTLSATNVDPKSGLAPYGYRYTEAIAVLVDHMSMPPEPPADDPHAKSEPNEDGDKTDPDKVGNKPAGAEGANDAPTPPPVTPEEAKKLTLETTSHWWDDVRLDKPSRPRRAPGGIGTKRKATNIGRSPRRIARIATDPYQRVFDRKSPGKGGVVLIDGSASMKMTREDVLALVNAAPGCTVLMYCGDSKARTDGLPNMWVLADKGTMVDVIPERHRGNGVDFPAIQTAIQMRQRKDSPVVWVTDGLCHGPGQRYVHAAAVDCAKAALLNGVIMRPTLETAVEALNGYMKGRKPLRWFPAHWRTSWQKTFDRELPPNQASPTGGRYHT